MRTHRLALLACVAASLSGCLVGPDYQRPTVSSPAAFKETAGWKQSQPADALSRGPWWELFNDPVLSDLERRVAVSNQNLAAAEAAYRQARAAITTARSQLFPTLGASASANVAGGGGRTTSTVITTGGDTTTGGTTTGGTTTGGTTTGGTTTSTSRGVVQSYSLALDAAWAPDLWGRIRRNIESARANAQASEADLASARLSAQAQVATAYVQLRATDEDRRLLDQTVTNYQSSLKVAQNRYAAGVADRSEILTAQSQLESAQAEAAADDQTRAQLEHAIAVLVGEAPANFTIAPAPWSLHVPDVPVAVPSVLLERRPDVAAAERRAASANALIGVQQAAYYPDINLSASAGPAASSIGGLFNTSNFLWSLGSSAAATIFDAGARRSAVQQARAAYEQTVAQYRQAVLTAFQEVEDQLAASNHLTTQETLRRAASSDADRAEQIVNNQYRAGTVSRSDLFVAQTTALSARRTALGATEDRLIASVSLIQALGGGWTGLGSEPTDQTSASARN